MGDMGVFETISFYFVNYALVRYALVVGVLIALCSSLLGVTLVLKRFSFIGDGLSRVAFMAGVIASIAHIVPTTSQADATFNAVLTFVLPLVLTVIVAIILLNMGHNSKINGDAAVAMISVAALAAGYMLMNLYSKSSNITADVCASLFGATKILTLNRVEVWMCVAMSIVATTFFVLFYNKIFAITFDENFATATGVKAKKYNLLLSVVIAMIIVLAVNLVGALLISALIIFPALSAMRVFRSFISVTLASVVISTVCAALGILLAILQSTPVGATIVMVNVAGFFVFSLVGFVARKVRARAAPGVAE